MQTSVLFSPPSPVVQPQLNMFRILKHENDRLKVRREECKHDSVRKNVADFLDGTTARPGSGLGESPTTSSHPISRPNNEPMASRARYS